MGNPIVGHAEEIWTCQKSYWRVDQHAQQHRESSFIEPAGCDQSYYTVFREQLVEHLT